MSVSNSKSFRSLNTSRNRKQVADFAKKNARRPLARRAFFESLEGRSMMAFTPGDVFAGSFNPTYGLYNVTAGGDFAAATPLANFASSLAGQTVWTDDLNTAYVSVYGNNSVVKIDSAGTITPFATGLSGPTGLLLASDGRLLVGEYGSSEVTDITAGGDFTGATPFASGVLVPRNLIELTDGRILVAQATGNVLSIGAGGDFSAAAPFADGLTDLVDLVQSSSGAILVSSASGAKVVDISAGGNFSLATPFATGRQFSGLTFDGQGRLLASVEGLLNIYDITAGGNFSAAAPFASNLPGYYAEGSLDTVPGTVTGSLTAVLQGPNLVVSDTDATGKDNDLTISVIGGKITVSDAVEEFTSAPAGWTLSADRKSISILAGLFAGQININGAGGNDTLTVQAAALTNRVNYDGGVNGNDILNYDADGAADLHLAYGNTYTAFDKSGTISDGANIKVSYSNLAPVVVTNVLTALTFDLPAVTDPDAVISYDGANIVLTGSSFETTTVNLTGITSVTVNGNGGNDNITVAASYLAAQPPLDINTAGGTDTILLNGVAQNVSTGAGDDVITVGAGKATSIDGGTNFNTLNLPANSAVTVTAIAVTGATGTETTKTIAFSNITKLAGDGSGSLTGPNTPNTWEINDGGTSTINTNLTFSGFKTLSGGDAVDTFNVRNNTAVTYTLNGGKSLDLFNLGSVANKLDSIANITINDSAANDGANLTLNDQGNTTAIDYTMTANAIGRTAGFAATFSGLTNVSLNAGSGNNKLTITGVPTLTDVTSSIGFNLSTGNDTLDITNVNPTTVVDLGAPSADATGFNGNLTAGGRVSVFSGVEVINAKAATAGDQLTGIDVASTWTINEAATNTYERDSEPARKLTFTGMDTLQGLNQVDTFNVLNNSLTSTYLLNGGNGLDVYNLGTANKLDGITNPISLDGQGNPSTLPINDQGNTGNLNYSLSGAIPGFLGSIGRTGIPIKFAGVTDLIFNAGSGNNAVTATGIPVLTGNTILNLSTGIDTLDIVSLNPATVTLTNKSADTTGFNGDVTSGSKFTFTGVETIAGDKVNLGDQLTGLGAASTWSINDSTTSTYAVDSDAGRKLSFNGLDILQGNTTTAAVDKFTVTDHSNTPLYQLRGGKGLDEFTLLEGTLLGGPLAANLRNIEVYGEADSGNLTLNDSATAAARNYTLDATSIQRLDPPTPPTTPLSKVTYNAITNLTLKASNGDNKIFVTAMPTVTGVSPSVVLSGGTGDDSLDLSAAVLNPITVKLTQQTPAVTTGYDGTVNSGVSNFSFTAIEGITAPSGIDDKLEGLTQDSRWTINDSAANNTYALETNLARTLRFKGFEKLQGSTTSVTGIDRFEIEKNDSTALYQLYGGPGLDVFNFGPDSLLTNGKNVEAYGEAGNAKLTVDDSTSAAARNYTLDATSIQRLDPPTPPTTPLGKVTYNAINILTLKASNGANKIFVTAMPTVVGASPSVVLNGGTGDDSLDLSAAVLNPITVKLTQQTPAVTTGYDGTVNSGVSNFSFTAIEGITAPSGIDDKLEGLTQDSRWTINDSAANNTYALETNLARTLRFKGFEKLQGSTTSVTGIDRFEIEKNDATALYQLYGGPGLDVFNFGPDSLLTNGKNVEAYGEAGNAKLTVDDSTSAAARNYTLDATSIQRLDPPTPPTTPLGKVTYSAINSLTLKASNGANKIIVTAMPTVVGTSPTVDINGGTGNDTLDLTNAALNPIKVTLSKITPPDATATGFDGKTESGGKQFNFTAVEKIDAPSGAGDELVGIASEAIWTINDKDGSSYVATSPTTVPNRTLNWSNFEKLTGNSLSDTFKVQDNDVSNPLLLDGKDGSDTFIIGELGNKLRLDPASDNKDIKSLEVIGGSGIGDSLILNDQGDAGNIDYTISPRTVTVSDGVVVTHSTIENYTLNASSGVNTITVLDTIPGPGVTNYTPTPSTLPAITLSKINLVDAVGASTLTVDDTADATANRWTVSENQVVRTQTTTPFTPLVQIDYSQLDTVTNLTLTGGSSVDEVIVTSTRAGVANTIKGNGGNDIFTVTNGDNLDQLKGSLSIEGGGNATDKWPTLQRGGTVAGYVFTATKLNNVLEKGDTLTVSDSTKAGLLDYEITNTTVTRLTAPTKTVTYKEVELLNVIAGSGDNDITIRQPSAGAALPTIVNVDGGGGIDNRLQIKGTTGADEITIGENPTAALRYQFEAKNIQRMWVEGNLGKDVIHNATKTVPGLLDGGFTKDATQKNTGGTAQNDIISSDAIGTATYSSVVLGNDGLDAMFTSNTSKRIANSSAGTTYLVGDYFINNNVPTKTGANVDLTPTSRIQVVNNPAGQVGLRDGETGDKYVTTVSGRNWVLARLDTNADAYGPLAFENATVDKTNLSIIKWLQGKLAIKVSSAGIVEDIAAINHQVRLFLKKPGAANPPAYGDQTYNPGGLPTATINANPNQYMVGGEGPEETGSSVVFTQNPFEKTDVNGDGMVTAFDALLIINELNLKGAHSLDTSENGEYGMSTDGEAGAPINFLDVNGDSAVSAFDAIVVINRLNQGQNTYQLPTELEDTFARIDDAESAAAQLMSSQAESSGYGQSVTDDALLALLAADYDDQHDNQE